MALLLNVFIKSLFRCRQFLLNFINELITENIWALSQENLSDYTIKYAQLQRKARILKLSLLDESRFNSTLQKVNSKGADQTAEVRRLVCAFAVHMNRPPDKSVYWKIIFFISHPKHMLWVLKRTVSMRLFF